MSNIIVYTAIFGGYDWLQAPVCDDVRHVCFTDNAQAKRGWDMRVVDRLFTAPVRDARMYKILSHQFLPEADVTIWHDANVTLRVHPQKLVDALEDCYHVATFEHPERGDAYEEAKRVVELGMAPFAVVKAQMDQYREGGYPPGLGLAETTVMVRTNADSVEKLNNTWWSEITRHTWRDQLSFDYVCWLLDMGYAHLPVRDIRDSNWFDWRYHGVRQ